MECKKSEIWRSSYSNLFFIIPIFLNERKSWATGDVIGSCIDLEERTITFYRNGKNMGVAFKDISVLEEGLAYFPTVSLSYGEKCYLNFGGFPFQYPVEDYHPLQHGADETILKSRYFVKSIDHLLKQYLQNASNVDKDELFLLFVILFDFYGELLANEYAAQIPFIEYLMSLDQAHLSSLFDILTVSVEESGLLLIMKRLLWFIGYRSRTTSWIPPNTGSTAYIEFLLKLLKCSSISLFLRKYSATLSELLESILEAKLPNNLDLEQMFSSLPSPHVRLSFFNFPLLPSIPHPSFLPSILLVPFILLPFFLPFSLLFVNHFLPSPSYLPFLIPPSILLPSSLSFSLFLSSLLLSFVPSFVVSSFVVSSSPFWQCLAFWTKYLFVFVI